jgi:dienelactone hydrolase
MRFARSLAVGVGVVTAAALLHATRGAAPVEAAPEIEEKAVEYKQGDTVCEGFLAVDPSVQGKRPGVLVVHEWMGLVDFTKDRTRALAKLGYVAFAADVYGKGVRPKDAKEAGEQAGKLKGDRALLRARTKAALDLLLADPRVDASRIGAIGYCFGGTAVLELARSGAPVAATVTFHGGLDTPTPADAKNVKGKVLALAGGDDPHVPPKQVADFEEEMRKGGVDWQVVRYGGAMHSFTNPGANDAAHGVAYDASADRRSWAAMQSLFGEVFAAK